MVLRKIFPDLLRKCLLSGKQIAFCFCNRCIGKEHRAAFHVIRTEVKQPCDIIQRGQIMDLCSLLLHFFTKSCKLALAGLSAISFRKLIYRGKGKLRPSFPCHAAEIFVIHSLSFCSLCKLFVRFSLSGCDHSAVKAKLLPFFQDFFYIVLHRRHTRLAHFHQCDITARKLSGCLDKIASICKKRCLILCHHQCPCRSGKATEVLSCHKILTDILTIMIV